MMFLVKLLIFMTMFWSTVSLAKGLEYIGIRAQMPSLEFDIDSLDESQSASSDDSNRLDFVSKEPVILGFFASYYGLGLGFSKTLQDEEGASEYLDVDLSWYGDRVAFKLGLSRIEDFFVSEGYGDIDVDALSDDELENEGVYLENVALDITVTLIKFRLSLKEAFEAQTHPKKSGGGVISIFTADRTYFDGPSFIIPESIQSYFGGDGTLLEGTLQSINLQLGWGHSIVMGSIYVSILGAFGPGTATVEYDLEDSTVEDTVEASKTTIMGAIGYSSKGLFLSLEADYRSQEYILDSISFATLRTSLSANLGYSF